MLSHVASKGLDEVIAEKKEGQEIAWQLYMKKDRLVTLLDDITLRETSGDVC